MKLQSYKNAIVTPFPIATLLIAAFIAPVIEASSITTVSLRQHENGLYFCPTKLRCSQIPKSVQNREIKSLCKKHRYLPFSLAMYPNQKHIVCVYNYPNPKYGASVTTYARNPSDFKPHTKNSEWIGVKSCGIYGQILKSHDCPFQLKK